MKTIATVEDHVVHSNIRRADVNCALLDISQAGDIHNTGTLKYQLRETKLSDKLLL